MNKVQWRKCGETWWVRVSGMTVVCADTPEQTSKLLEDLNVYFAGCPVSNAFHWHVNPSPEVH